MDLLKDITQSLRRDDESRRSDRTTARSDGGTAPDEDGTEAARASRANTDDESTAGNDEPDDHSPSSDATPSDGPADGVRSDDRATNGRSRTGTHVCSFCGAEFDADRRACPECDAEVVLRGER